MPQILVLVPEISLTPQMTSVFAKRFPDQVAVVHSGLSDSLRWQTLESMRSGQKRILIGPRSAVFAGMRNLQGIIVDEEHDQSYKQASAPTYHGRDVAVVRAQMQRIPILLGSATPSLESHVNAKSGRYHFVELLVRANSRPRPELVIYPCNGDFKKDKLLKPKAKTSPGFSPVSTQEPPVITDAILFALQENLSLGRQAMVVANRRGYASFLLDLTEGESVRCPQCSISLTLHQRNKVLICHYCGFRLEVARFLRDKDPDNFRPVGTGSQKVEDFLAEHLPGANIARLDSDISAKQGALAEILENFRMGKIDILVGTQILAKGHDFANVALIVVLEVDHQLRLPDFRAGERTFQLLVQAAGRSGRAEIPGQVIVQSDQVEHPVIQAAMGYKLSQFLDQELQLREQLAYPPSARLIAIEMNSENLPALQKMEKFCSLWLDECVRNQPQFGRELQILGPSIPPIERIGGRYRRMVLLLGKNLGVLRALAAQVYGTLKAKDAKVRVKIDVDPQSLM